MSSSTWTALAVERSTRIYELPLWRAVEAQHVIATRALVDSLQEQELLENILECDKPPIPPPALGLDYLLYTPFRYPPTREGSRFRAFTDAGVWYGADAIRTACAEVGYWRWRFLTASEGLHRLDAVPHTLFQALARGGGVDLRTTPFRRDYPHWTDPADYTACQAFARVARQGRAQIIRYRSVRDPHHGGAAAVLDPVVFIGTGSVRRRQSWFLSVDRQRVGWVRVGARQPQAYEFTFAAPGVSGPPGSPTADPTSAGDPSAMEH